MWGTTRPESFPRMWDQLLVRSVIDLRCRIIPTYVGSTTRAASRPSPSSNHSHVCGINRPVDVPRHLHRESFPRMWDQPNAQTFLMFSLRIIPTYVGSTCTTGTSPTARTNHSHVCGINPSTVSIALQQHESFPRMWDQLREEYEGFVEPRIIPTYVGSTLYYSS